MSVLIGHKLVVNAKIEKFKCDILSIFQTMWLSQNSGVPPQCFKTMFGPTFFPIPRYWPNHFCQAHCCIEPSPWFLSRCVVALAFFPSCHHNHLAAAAVTGGGFPSSHGFSHENCCCRFCSCCCDSCCFRALFMFCRPVATLNGVVTTWAKAPTHVNMLRDSPIFPLRKEFFFRKSRLYV